MSIINPTTLLLRSLLYVPANNDRYLQKSISCAADCVILDLEDSVSFAQKNNARIKAREYLCQPRAIDKPIFVRINSLNSGLYKDDISSTFHKNLNGFVLTKIESASDILVVDSFLSSIEAQNHFKLNYFSIIVLIETASGLQNIDNILDSCKRIVAVCFGESDFLNSVHSVKHIDNPIINYAKSKIVTSCRSKNIVPIDTPFLDVHNLALLEIEKQISYMNGFSGTQLIHPLHLEISNKCYSPNMSEINYAKRVLDALSVSTSEFGATLLDGNMIDIATVNQSLTVLQLQKLISQLDNKNTNEGYNE